MIDNFINGLATYLKVDTTQFAEAVKSGDALKDGAEAELIKHIEALVKQASEHARTQEQEKQTNLLKKALSDKLTEQEKFYRDKFSLPESLKGEELQQAVAEKFEQLQQKDVDPDKIKSHPEYLRIQKEIADKKDAEWREKYGKIESEYNQFKGELEYSKVFDKVAQEAKKTWAESNVIDMPPAVAANQESEYFNRLKSKYKYKLDSTGTPCLVDDKGELLKDDKGHPIQLNDVLKNELINYVPVKASEDRSGGGAGSGNGAGNNTTYKGKLPNDKSELNAFKADIITQKRAGKISLEEMNSAIEAAEQKFKN